MEIDISKLKGAHVYLKELQQADIPALKVLAQDQRIWEFTKTLLITETYEQQFEQYISVALSSNGDGMFGLGLQKTFVIYRSTDDAVIGMTRYYGISEKHKSLDIGYTWYVPEVWKKVYNKECKLLLLQYAFEKLDFQRVQFDVAHQNIRSQKAVIKIGGTKEAVLRKHGLHADGTVRDTIVFSIIDDEWPEKKAALLKMIQV